ncbi:tripartite tricarboxylate transporter substrate binding protein [Ramlibacter sp. AW1]|uniref:Tripartite tricarboxylate transporter substrate binding protein n=1 Tax=Ramlibacter aurantiacus TaxID=2801330 RepID=A0A937D2H7_9BURK|nr:tripartite tricarboxylate transporter substrate binding protein [Ramlibacter aurantiacus]MBL0421624.1 tripartite tricarboxylate transporter substrate binding protein [Ramlibacter aurantiacus]
MRTTLSRRSLLALSATLLAGTSLPAWAAYPDKPVRLIVPFPAGGTVDAVARTLGNKLGPALGTTVVIENVPGAGGAIATQRVAKAPADGYTLLFTTPNHTINPALNDKLGFDTRRDLAPVSLVAEIPELLVANAEQPYNDFAGFVRYARANPGKLNYASAGNGTLPHVTMELLLQQLGLQVAHVPYKGAAPAMNDLLSGVVGLKMDTIATAAGHIRSGRLKPLAIASLKRSPLMPEVPTVAESGLPGYQGILWMGVIAPAGTPREVVDTLHQGLRKAVADPEVLRRFESDGVVPVANTPAEFEKLIDTELKQWAQLVRKSDIKAN